MFYAKINWFNSMTEEDEVDHIFIPAKSWNEAMQQITESFEWINSVEMVEMNDANMVYVPEDVVDTVKRANNF